VSLVAKLKKFNRIRLASIAFFAVTGILLLAFLPLTGFPPHVGFLGIVSLISAYSLFNKRAWSPWIVFILLITNTVFSLFTLYAVGFSNILVALCMLTYAGLTWIFSSLLLLKKKN
jgi:hypothetical protein